MHDQTDWFNKMHCQDLQDLFIMFLESGFKEGPVLVEFWLNYARTLRVDWIRGPQTSKRYIRLILSHYWKKS
jgi:hypothetical protein